MLSGPMPMPPAPTSAPATGLSSTGPQSQPTKSTASAAPTPPAVPATSAAAQAPPSWNPALASFLAALAAANPASFPVATAPPTAPPASTPMFPNAQPAAAQMAAATGFAGFPPNVPPPAGAAPTAMTSATGAPPASAYAAAAPPFFPPNLPYAGLAAMGYPTQSTLAASALLSGLPLPGALPTAAAPPPAAAPPGIPLTGSATPAGALALPAGFNPAAAGWPSLANLGLLNPLGAAGVAAAGGGAISNFSAGASPSSSSSSAHVDGTPSSPVASSHNALATTSKKSTPAFSLPASTAMVSASSASSDLGSPPPGDSSSSSTTLVAPKPLSVPSSALAAVSAQVKAAAASDGLSGPVVKPGAQPNGTSQSSMTLTKNLSQFLLKLYNMVDDPTTDDLIHWSDAGTSFVVENAEDLAKSVLPKFFKHSNFSSFVRQLNMYSFRKVSHITQGSLAGSTEDHRWEFSNDHFVRGLPDQLCFITRKKANAHDAAGDGTGAPGDLSNVLVEVSNVRKHQLTLSSEQKELQAHVQLLWRDMLSTKDQVARQQVTIDKILRFLASLYSAKDAKGSAASVAGNKLATGVGGDVTEAGGTVGSGRGHDPEQSNIRKRKLQLLEYNPSSSAAGSGGSRPGSPIGSSPVLMDLEGFPDGVGVADIEQLPDSPTFPSPKGSPLTGLRMEEVQDEDEHGEADDGMDVDGIRVTSTKANKGKTKAKPPSETATSPQPSRRSSNSSASANGGRRSGAAASKAATSAAKALEAVASGGTVLSPPPTKAARKSNRTAGTSSSSTSRASAGQPSRSPSSASSALAPTPVNGNHLPVSPSLAATHPHNGGAPQAHALPSMLSADISANPLLATTTQSVPTASTLPTPEERLLWLTNEASRLGSHVQSLNPTIDDLTETAAAELSADLDLDVLLGSLPDISAAISTAAGMSAIPPAIPMDAGNAPPSGVTPAPIPSGPAATQAAAGLPHLSPEAIMNLLHNPNALAMLAAVQGSGAGEGQAADWSQLGAPAKMLGQASAAPTGASGATAPSPNLGDLSAFLSFESDNDVDGDTAMGD